MFVPDSELTDTVQLLAQATDTTAEWGDVVRSDGTTAPRATVIAGDVRIEIGEGRVAAPALLEITVPDKEAAERAVAGTPCTAKHTMVGTIIKTPSMTLILRDF